MTDEEADALFHGVAHAHRRRILDLVSAEPGIAVGGLASYFDVSRIAVMNHLATLERAGPILSEKAGASRRLYLNTTPIRAIYERWTSDFSRHWAGHLLDIKRAGEQALASIASHSQKIHVSIA